MEEAPSSSTSTNLTPFDRNGKYEISMGDAGKPRFDETSYFNKLDPTSALGTEKNKIQRKDVKGYLIALTFNPVEFYSYEMYAFVESHLQLEIEDLSIFRDEDNKPSGIVIVQFFEEVSLEKLKMIHGAPFKGLPVLVRLFSSIYSFNKFVTSQVDKELSHISLPLRVGVPLVYVQGFKGNIDDVNKFFGRCGKITLIREKEYNYGSYFILYFGSEAEAKKACRAFMGFSCSYGNLLVSPLYSRSAERCFSISFCEDPSWLKDEIEQYGHIFDMIQDSDGTIYVLMDNIESAKNACTLLNGMICQNSRILTSFIEYEHFDTISKKIRT